MTGEYKMSIVMNAIGSVRTPYTSRENTPKSGLDKTDQECEIILNPELEEGIADIHPGDKYYLIFCFDQSIGKGFDLTVPVRGVGPMRSLFATRSPHRPNPIGLSQITVTGVNRNVIRFTGADMFDGTPVLDLKPVITSKPESKAD